MKLTRREFYFFPLVFLLLTLGNHSQGEECRRFLGAANRLYTVGNCIRNVSKAASTLKFPNLIVDTETGLVKANMNGREGDLQINNQSGALTGPLVNRNILNDLYRYYQTFRPLFTGASRDLIDRFLNWARPRLDGKNPFPANNIAIGTSVSHASGSNPPPQPKPRAAASAAGRPDRPINCTNPNESVCNGAQNGRRVAQAFQQKLNEFIVEFKSSDFAKGSGGTLTNVANFAVSKFPQLEGLFGEAKEDVEAGMRLDGDLDPDTLKDLNQAINEKVTLLYNPKSARDKAKYGRECGVGFTDNALYDDRTDQVTLCWGRVINAVAVCVAQNRPIGNCLRRTLMHEIGHFVEKFLKQRAKKQKSSGKVVSNEPVNRFMDCFYDNFSTQNISREEFRESAAMGENLADRVASLGYQARFQREGKGVVENAREASEGFANICGIPASDDHPSSAFRVNAFDWGCSNRKICGFSGLRG